MNEEQLRLFIRQAFALSNREEEIIKAINPTLLRSMVAARRLIETLPPEGDLFREKAYRDLLPEIRKALLPLNNEFARQLAVNLTEEAPEMAEEAVAMVEAIGVPAPAQTPVEGLPRMLLQDSVRVALNARVEGQRVLTMFEPKGDSGLTDWLRTNERAITREVTRGILEGAPTEDIAKAIVQISERGYVSAAGPTVTRLTKSQAKAIARTAVQDANRQVHEQVWQDNAEALDDVKWEWVAVLDSRTCPVCAPLDGRRWDDEDDAPEWPVHINCRCQVVPVDLDEETDVRRAQMVSPEEFRYNGKRLSELTGAERDKALASGLYASKVKVNGDNLYRKAVEVKGDGDRRPTYADFLKSMNDRGDAGRVTQAEFFGGGEKGRDRAEWFRKATKAGRPADKALRDLIAGSGTKRSFKTEFPN